MRTKEGFNFFYNCWLASLFLLLSSSAFATHIVGGSLTYIHNGGSNYTVTLKLYRDCSPGTASFPNSITVVVRGYDGATFPTSRDFNISLGPVTPVPSNLDSCALPPNPMPCVEEGLYTRTVNLPANPGGYHLYYQLIARNLSLTNINATCNCVGESYYAYIPGNTVNWFEDFNLANNTTTDVGTTDWTRTLGVTPPNYAQVNNGVFEFSGANNGEAAWVSQSINISAIAAGVNVNIDLYETGTLEANDSIQVFYSLNGGAWTPFATNSFFADDFTSAVSSVTGLIGNTLQIMVKVHYDANSPSTELYRIDNVDVYTNDFVSNSDPVFNLFPPLFLCAGEPFTFDHAATDPDGDSLVYSFYTPYDGDNGVGALDPTFSGNTAIFTPITFLGGFSSTNPLGGAPLTLNPVTGLLSGTPSALGQYVVGIKVKEYRNGIYIGETIRDFQFNIVNCPPDAQALLNPMSVCSGSSHTFSNVDPNATNWWWNFGDPSTNADTSTAQFPTYTYTPGTYSVTLIVNKGTTCADTAVAPILVGFVNASFTHDAPKCSGSVVSFTDNSTKSSNATINSWSWNFGDAGTSTSQNPTHAYITGGTYTVVLTASTNIGCTDTAIRVLTIHTQPTITAISDKTVCANNASSVLGATVTSASGMVWTTNGTGAFSPNATTAAATYVPSSADTALGVLTFTATTTGNATCNAATDITVLTISDAPVANAGADISVCASILNVALNGLVQNASGGLWTTSGSGVFTPNATSLTNTYIPSVADVSIGTLTLTLTSTGNAGCVPVVDYTRVTITPDSIAVSAGNDTTVCSPDITLNGQVKISSGGRWSSSGTGVFLPNDSTLNARYVFSTTDTTNGSVTLILTTIGNGACAAKSDTVVVSVPDFISIAITSSDSICGNGNSFAVSTSVSTGQGIWSTFGSGIFSPSTTSLSVNYTPSIVDIQNGSVQLVFTSANNGQCAATKDTQLVVLTPAPSLTVTTTNVSCFAGSNGTAMVSAFGASVPYMYLWSSNASSQSASLASALTSGIYTVTVTDSKNCFSIGTTTVTQPSSALSMSVVAINNVSCNAGSDGNIQVAVFGGTAPYFYNWQPTANMGNSISNLTMGNYTVTITDNNGCSIINNTLVITEPAALSMVITPSFVTCNSGSNGAASAVVSGGTAPYKFLWSINNTNSTISSLPIGVYGLTVTDAEFCVLTETTSITQPPAITHTISFSNATCFQSNGSATIAAAGGSGAFSFVWNNGQTTATATSLVSANYQATITDGAGCNQTTNVQIFNEPGVTAQPLATTTITCFGQCNGAGTVGSVGGRAPYSYVWFNGSTSTTVTGLCAGLYTATVTDSTGCVSSTAFFVNQPALLTSSVVFTNVLCYSGTTGDASLIVTGGKTPYTYYWSNGATTFGISGLPAAMYQATISDANNCSTTNTVTITEPAQLLIQTNSVVAVSCYGDANGVISASVVGGSGSYQYSWSSLLASSSVVSNLTAGVYSLTVTDQNLCTDTSLFIINQPAVLATATTSITNPTCYAGNNGSASASVSGGTPNYQYSWQGTAQTTVFATGLIVGSYTLLVSDANNCKDTLVVTLSEPLPVIAIAGTLDSICFGQSVSISATATGGGGSYSYSWIPGLPGNDSVQVVSPTTTTNYTIIAYDQNGCSYQADTAHVEVINLAGASVVVHATTPICPGQSTQVYVSVAGNPGQLAYTWNQGLGNSPGTFTVTPTQPTTYVVTVVNSCGVSVTDSVQVLFNPPPTVVIMADTISGCTPITVQFSDASITGNVADPITSWFWNFGDGVTSTNQINTHTYTSAGTYSVTLIVTTSQGCTNTNSLTPFVVQAFSIPDALFSVNSTILTLPSDTLKCTNLSIGAASYYWTFGDGNFSTQTNPVNVYQNPGVYDIWLVASNAYGCSDTASVTIKANQNLTFPNAFTPDPDNESDGYYDVNSLDNNIFFPYAAGVVEYHLLIFDRWGELIFETHEVNRGWNGYLKHKICQQGVYIFKVEGKFVDGKKINKTGDVTLLR
ncbi:MAG: PKD domain-containing protein [Bacteroidetes bacterium]|nr:PKD domain-containing protein [Bacteroidota bacterium]